MCIPASPALTSGYRVGPVVLPMAHAMGPEHNQMSGFGKQRPLTSVRRPPTHGLHKEQAWARAGQNNVVGCFLTHLPDLTTLRAHSRQGTKWSATTCDLPAFRLARHCHGNSQADQAVSCPSSTWISAGPSQGSSVPTVQSR